MSPTVLAEELANLVPAATEIEAVTTFADAYAIFAADAMAGAAPITPAGVLLGKTAMAPLLIGMSTPGQGAAKMTQGVQAFWVAVAGGLAVSFAGAIAIVPPSHAALQPALEATFATNTASSASKEDATTLMATVFYSQAILGGTVTFPPSVVTPIL
jgi:hypothetical protein